MAIGIDYTAGIPHTNGAPVHDPGTNGSKQAYDHVNRVKYKHVSGTTWEVDASGGGATVSTDATLDGDGSGGDPLTIAQQSATSGQVLKWSGSAWVPGDDSSGGGGSLGTGFTGGGDYGSIPTDTFVDVASVLRFQGAGTVFFDGSVTFTYGAAFDTSLNVYYDLSVDGVINTTSIGNPGANGKTGVTFDDTENVERLSFFINDVEKVGLETNGTLDMKTTAGAFIPPRLTESERDALTPGAGWTIFCTDTTADDSSTGVTQTYNGSAWKSHW